MSAMAQQHRGRREGGRGVERVSVLPRCRVTGQCPMRGIDEGYPNSRQSRMLPGHLQGMQNDTYSEEESVRHCDCGEEGGFCFLVKAGRCAAEKEVD